MASLNIYALVVKLRNRAYDRGVLRQRRLPGKVISIGNIVAGGTGKTPVVCRLAEYLVNHGDRPAILTRGYRSGLKRGDCGLLLNGAWHESMRPAYPVHADEAMMQSQLLKDVPVIVGAKRWAAANKFLACNDYQPTHWILDDGYQHRKLFRDVDIVLLDSRNPYDGGHLLPTGHLREPIANLNRASAICFTRSDAQFPIPDDLAIARRYSSQVIFIPFQAGRPRLMVGSTQSSSIDGAKVCVVAGIANPDRFIREVVAAGGRIANRYIVKDHQRFQTAEIQEKSQDADAIVTTPKDYWREPEIFVASAKPVFVLPIDAEWSDTSISELLQRFI